LQIPEFVFSPPHSSRLLIITTFCSKNNISQPARSRLRNADALTLLHCVRQSVLNVCYWRHTVFQKKNRMPFLLFTNKS